MGDSAAGHDCDAFVIAFEDDLVRRFRSEFLDLHFGDRVSYFLYVDPTWWLVELIASITTGVVKDGQEQVVQFRVESAPVFAPHGNDAIVYEVAMALDMDEDVAEKRLREAEEIPVD